MLGRFCGLFIPALLSAVSCLMLIYACIGTYTSSNKFVTSIFLLELNLSGASVSTIFNSTVTSQYDSLSALGLSDVYTFGMWGYCRGDSSSADDSMKSIYDQDFTLTSCTDPKPMYTFNPVGFLVNEIQDQAGITISSDDIDLPSDVESYVKTAGILSKIIFICNIIAICIMVICLFVGVTLGCCCNGFLCVNVMLSTIGFIAAILSSGCATGMGVYIKKEFNNNFSDYGVVAKLSRNFLVFTWVGTGLALASALFWFITACCGCFGGRKKEVVYVEEKPGMTYYH